MIYLVLADLAVLLHLAFVAFVLAGGLLVARRPAVAWAHLPAAAWGAWVELAGWGCPLTRLEDWLRVQGGGQPDSSGFLAHHLLPVLYPSSLPRAIQGGLGVFVVLVNAAVYASVLRRRFRARPAAPGSGRAPLAPGRRLDGNGLSLRPPSRDEMPFVRGLWSDPETMEAVGGPVRLGVEEAERWHARMVDPGRPTDCYCLIRMPDGRPVGEISFHRYDARTRTAGLNVKVAASERGRGIGREAMRTLLEYYFGEFGGLVMTDDLAPENTEGQAALTRFGFRRVQSAGPAVRFEMTRDEFEALHPSEDGADG